MESKVMAIVNGVDFLDPLKPNCPALAQEITLPFKSLRVTIVLLNEETEELYEKLKNFVDK